VQRLAALSADAGERIVALPGFREWGAAEEDERDGGEA
jgi:hypothetical protein